MKILEEKYPLGTIKGQKTPGRYVDGILYDNIKILAKKIVDDMTFLSFISSSTLEVGTGKSVFAQQLAETYIAALREMHGYDLDLTMNNIVFKPEDLIERSFKLPKYSVIILDEWEDAHYWSKLGMTLRQFFRKCRQLNLFMIAIIPNFFQLPKNYAMGRSVFFIDVQFRGEFERGYFSFYNFKKKKDLYIYGKKTENYSATTPNFTGRFTDGYVVDEKEYRAAKLRDMEETEKIEINPLEKKEVRVALIKMFRENAPEITQEQLARAFLVHVNTIQRWAKEARETTTQQDLILINKLTDNVVEPEKIEGFVPPEELYKQSHHSINADESLKE